MASSSYVALLRGINVGGRNSLPMKALRTAFEDLGCENVRTYIQSGNVVFRFSKSTKKLGQHLAASINSDFGFQPSVLILKEDDFSNVVASNPFVKCDVEPKNIHVAFLAEPATNPNTRKLEELQSATEKFELSDSAFYLLAPDGIGRSKLAARMEGCLGVVTTARNLRTLRKINELLTHV